MSPALHRNIRAGVGTTIVVILVAVVVAVILFGAATTASWFESAWTGIKAFFSSLSVVRGAGG